MTQTIPSPRGFSMMDPERQRLLAKKGGQAAHQNGTAHQFTTNEAREAGRKGGNSISRNREYMAMIGKKGGRISGDKRRKSKSTVLQSVSSLPSITTMPSIQAMPQAMSS